MHAPAAVPTMLLRPQPLGVFPFPAGLLLLPEPALGDAVATTALDALLQGAEPSAWPDAWHGYALALAGDRTGALAAFPDDDALSAYNRFVLGGEVGDLTRARDLGDDTLRTLASLAAFVQGLADDVPDLSALDGELLANGLLAAAAAQLERRDDAAARAALDAGIEAARATSPVLAAQLLAQRASLTDDVGAAEALWREALLLAGDSPLPGLVGELRASLGMVVQQGAETDRRRLVEAVQLYHAAVQAGVTRERNPELWARVQANLGLAYVSIPMSESGEKLRLGVAVQAFREALTVYTRESHPEAWASTMANMANAMQYLPSSHQQENLVDAVNAYEELLTVRQRALDPVGYARLLANQGNALAHLGIFSPALEKLTEAHKLLHWHGEADAAARILEQVEAVNAQLATGAAGGAAPADADLGDR